MIEINSYEVLKESKIIYENLVDILDNADIQILNGNQSKIKEFMTVLADIYDNAYKQAKEYMKNELETICNCPKCQNKLLISDLIDYSYLCDECDENYYYIEIENHNKWYLTNDNNERLIKSFSLGLNYNVDKKIMYIGTENSSGAKYICDDIDDIKESVNDYIFGYVNHNTFNIKIWETEEDRIQGEPIILDEIYHNLKDAVARLKKIMSRQDYAFAEIINEEDDLFYSTDGVSEEYYKKDNLEI